MKDYFKEIQENIDILDSIHSKTIEFIEFDRQEGMIRGTIHFLGGFTLQLMEYIIIDKPKPKYRYHFMDKDGELIFRHDNAPHHRNITTFPHHKHMNDGSIIDSHEVSIIDVLKEIERHISTVV